VPVGLSCGAITMQAGRSLRQFRFPNVYFHITTAYDLLRHKRGAGQA